MYGHLSYEENMLLRVRKIMRALDMHSSNPARELGLTPPAAYQYEETGGNRQAKDGFLIRISSRPVFPDGSAMRPQFETF